MFGDIRVLRVAPAERPPGVAVTFGVGGSAAASAGIFWSLTTIQSNRGHRRSVRSVAHHRVSGRRGQRSGRWRPAARGQMTPPFCALSIWVLSYLLTRWGRRVLHHNVDQTDCLHLQSCLRWLLCASNWQTSGFKSTEQFSKRLLGLRTEFSVVSKGKISVRVILGVTETPNGKSLGLRRKSVDIIYVDF